MTNRYLVGFLILTILVSGIVYIQLSNKVKIRVDNDKTTFYVPHEEYPWLWIVSGREYNKLFDGTSLMYRDVSSIKIDTKIENNKTWIIRNTTYQRGPKIVDTYYFDGNINSAEMFPISHTVEIYNGSGYFYRYEVRDLEYSGETKKLDVNSMRFGKNMKVEWQEKNKRWARVYKSGILKVQYDIPSDYEKYEVRLFDPEDPPKWSQNSTNSTIAGTTILHSLKWEDDVGLSGYIFQFCNGTWNGVTCVGGGSGGGNWANPSFDKCRNITITNGGSSLTDFPVYINLTKDDDMQSDFSDLRFYSEGCGLGGSELNYEIEDYTGSKADIWVKTNLSAGSNVISVYYKNNTPVSSGENPTGVWDNGFAGVWHMKDNTLSTIKDSANYSNDGTKRATNQPIETDGKIAKAQDFDGSDDYINCGSDSSLDITDELTISAWAKSDSSSPGYSGVANRFYVQLYAMKGYMIGTANDQKWNFLTGDESGGYSWLSSGVDVDTNWHYIVGTFDGTTKRIYVDGEFKTSEDKTIGGKENLDFHIGVAYHNLNYKFDGKVDEVRVSNVERSAAWINQTYQLITNQGTYVVEGSEESKPTGGGGGWVNDTWVPMTGTTNWSNVTKLITSDVGVNVSWCVYANDTSNNWNSSCDNPFWYETTSAEEDTCTYVSGNWNVDCSDNCLITSNVDLGGNNLIFTNTGKFTLQSNVNITNIGNIQLSNGCEIILNDKSYIIL